MKKLRYIAGSGALMLLTAFAASCTDGNDWGTDASYDRLFGTQESSFSITAADNIAEAEATWAATQNTSSYIIEVSTSALTDDVEMGTTEGSIVYGNGDEQITGTTYTLKGLAVNATYYARIKSVGVGKESNWVALDGTFTTCEEEQILNAPSTDAGDITENSIKISWIPCEVDRIRIFTADGSYDETFELSEADVAFASYTFEGLSRMTPYTVEILNGETVRGTWSGSTAAGEMIAISVSSIGATEATFSWAEDGVDGYGITPGTEFASAPSVTDISGKSATVTGLTEYAMQTVTFFSGSSPVGYKTIYTQKTIPANCTRVTSADELEAALKGTGEVNILIPAGTTVSGTNEYTIGAGVTSLRVFGEYGDTRAKIIFRGFKPDESNALQNIELFNLEMTAEDTGQGYAVNINQKCTANTDILIDNCIVKDSRGVVRIQGTDTGLASALGDITIKNSIVQNIGSYGVINIYDSKRATLTLGAITISGTTVNKVNGASFIRMLPVPAIIIEQSTFYNMQSGKTMIDTNKQKAGTITVSNTLFGKNSSGVDNFKGFEGPTMTAENTYWTTDCGFQSKYALGDGLSITSAELFDNPEGGSFAVLPTDYKAFGDQRWNPDIENANY